ncbi:MAG: 3',5'-cyclic-nucleotide phosphodiesterase [Chitinophagaceae bacterium]
MKFYHKILLIVLVAYAPYVWSQPVFKVVPLGIKGGIDESNLSSYMLAVEGTNDFICLDAGTLHYGIQKAVTARVFKDSVSYVLRNYIKAYLVSHPHLDHVAGLIINSPEDGPKNIYGLPHCIEVLKDKYFTWESWANFADDGEKPLLKKYHYNILSAGKETAIDSTQLTVRAFPLSHVNPYESTAFLVRYNENYLLYLGDTGADSLEKASNLRELWKEVGPLIAARKLKAIFMEVSYANDQPNNLLFGHLTPNLLMKEMDVLALVSGADALKGLPIVITHMKPSGKKEETIKKQLIVLNKLNLQLVFPQQARLLKF